MKRVSRALSRGGQLRDVIEPQRTLHAAVVSRVKVMAQLDMRKSVCRRMADYPAHRGRPWNVRVSTLPTGMASA